MALASEATVGTAANAYAAIPALSGDGLTTASDSGATNLLTRVADGHRQADLRSPLGAACPYSRVDLLPLDARIDSAPMRLVVLAAKALPPGEVLLIRRRWELQPFYDALSRAGFEWFSKPARRRLAHLALSQIVVRLPAGKALPTGRPPAGRALQAPEALLQDA